MNGNEDRGNFIGTYSGLKFYPLDPRLEEICIIDITESLAKQCRYTGHTSEFYSVAEHSYLLAEYVLETGGDADFARWALMHDASEAYVSDVPRPLKPMFPEFKPCEERVQLAIAMKYGMEWPIPDYIHDIDSRILFDEANLLMALPTSEWSFQLEPLGVELRLWDWKEAAYKFIWMAEALGIKD